MPPRRRRVALTEAVDRVSGKGYACKAFVADLAAKPETRSAAPRSWSGGVGSQQDRGQNRSLLHKAATAGHRAPRPTNVAGPRGPDDCAEPWPARSDHVFRSRPLWKPTLS